MRRAFSACFLILGAVILLGMPTAVLRSLDKPAVLLRTPEDAVFCAEELAEALSRGDFKMARELIWGLSEEPETWQPPDEASSLIWQAYLDSVACDVPVNGGTTQIGVACDMTVSTMDIARVAAAASQTAVELLEGRGGAEEVDALLREAAEKAIRENSDRIVREIRLDLVCIDGIWYVLPDEQLLLVLSGNLEE